VVSQIANIVLVVLVVILAVLLIIRQRQLKQSRPLGDLGEILDQLQRNLTSIRAEGKIQKTASHLSDILINNLRSERILFFRRQRRFMEMNYVYGMKNVQRARYRIKVTDALLEKLTGGNVLSHPRDLREVLGADLSELLANEQFNVVFPIYWRDILFGVYFIRTALSPDDPLIRTFLLFLNQNLSAAYHVSRLESSRLGSEVKNNTDRGDIQPPDETKRAETAEGDEDPGHLIEMFRHRNVDELIAGIFEKVKTGLKADKLVFVSHPGDKGKKPLDYALGADKERFNLDGDEFQRLFGQLQKRQVYPISHLGAIKGGGHLKTLLEQERLGQLATFSLSDEEPGILFWDGKVDGNGGESRLLTRLERVARRALVNAREFERVEAMSYTDSLTGLYNHRYFVKRLNEEIQRAVRYHRKVGLLLFDIDDFKLYNDNFGHQWGDRLLRHMGKTLSKTLRSIDIVSRYGGDEFGIIMPEADKSTCGVFMDRLRHAIAATDFRDQADGFEGRITISIGSAIFPDDADDSDRLIYCADMALFKSKDMGRNRSTSFQPELLAQNDSH
jgi:diguanylate cyclase (GGDEF)-like protein